MKRFLIRLLNGENTLFQNTSTQEESMTVLSDSSSEKLSISGVSAATTNSTDLGQVVVTPDVDCFVTQGVTPVAVADGTDQILLAYNSYRLTRIVDGNKLAFITAGATGNIYISPGA